MTAGARAPRIWPVLIAALAGTVILLSLGVWQVKRLAWKEALLAQLAARAAAAPVDLTEAAAIISGGGDVEFQRVKVPGRYLAGGSMKMIATYDSGQGWTIITPAVSEDGWAVLVDRGRIPASGLAQLAEPDGPVVLDGVLRRHAAARGTFDPVNDPAANLWYWWDVPAMQAAAQFPAGLRPFPAVLQLLAQPGASPFPRPDQPKATLANNHLGYAITWFGLAATLVGVTGVYIFDLRRRRKRPLDGPDHGG